MIALQLRNGAAAGVRGDHDLDPWTDPRPALISAAVLVPLIERPDGMTVMLTQRNDQLRDHPGQISFPGGRVEPVDATPAATALRETHEEIGLPAQCVSVIGRLDRYITRTGYDVTPIVGVVTPPFTIKVDAREVAEVFEVPLTFILESANYKRERRRFAGRTRTYYALRYADRYIWGATAGMLINLHQVLRN